MADTKYTLPEALHKLTVSLKEKLAKFESDVQEMRARELAPKEGKLAKHELCPLCGGPDRNGICNCLRKNAAMGYPQSTPGSGMPGGGPQSGGAQPMGMAEKKLTKCGPGCGGGKHMDKCDLSEVKRGDDLTKAMPTSSASALAPKAPAAPTSVGQANKEMGGFKSLASSPTAMPKTGGPSLTPGAGKKPISSMGRGSASAAGMIPNAKAEKNMGSARSPYGTGAAGHATTANYPSAIKEHLGKLGKDEKQMAPTPAAPERKVDGAKMPKKGKSVDAKKQGSGGEIKGGKSLSKAAPAISKAPEGAGVPGKQPVGQGGGDAHKTAATSGKAPHPDTTASLASVKGMKPSVVSQAKGKANVQQLRGQLAGIAAKRPAPASVDIDVSDFDKGPAQGAALKTAGAAEVNRLQKPDALQQVRNNANLKADKKAGGVGFLNALIRKFRPMAPAQGQQGSLTSQRFHGALPLQRAEKPMSKADLALSKMDEPLKKKYGSKVDELDKGLSGVNHNRKMLGVGELDKGFSANHNRSMMKASNKRSKAKKSR